MSDLRAAVETESGPDTDLRSAQPAGDELELLEARAARAEARGPKPTRVVAARGNLRQRLVELWRSRELLTFLVRKEIKVKYKNSFLGFLWSMLNPALTMAVFYVVFTFFIRNGIPSFIIYMFSAILLWNLFQTSVLTATGAMVNNAGIVKKVAFPREILAFAMVGSAVVFFFFQSIVMALFLLAFWHRPDWPVMWLVPFAALAVITFAAALAVFLSAVNVYLRDTQHLVEVLIAVFFWAVPGVYAFSGRIHDGFVKHTLFGIPGTHLIWLYFVNPVVPPVMTFQRVFYNLLHPVSTVAPHPHIQVMAGYSTMWYLSSDLIVIGVSVLLLLGALVVFGRLEGNFAEEL